MIIIGIAGKSGSGKTTLSRYLEKKYENITRIGVDEIVRSNGFTKSRNEIILGIATSSMSEKEYKEKRKDYSDRLDIYASKKVDEVKKQNPQVILVDYALLYDLEETWNKLDYKILVTRDKETTRKGLIKRSGKEKAEFLEIVNEKICENEEEVNVDYKIHNEEKLKNFYAEIDNIINEIFAKEHIY